MPEVTKYSYIMESVVLPASAMLCHSSFLPSHDRSHMTLESDTLLVSYSDGQSEGKDDVGLEYDSRLVMGTDVMSEKEPVAIFSDRSWKTSSGTYDASTETFRKARLAEIDSNYIDTIKNRVYYVLLR